MTLKGVINLKIILCVFEHLTGLKINFLKSEIHYRDTLLKQNDYTQIFACIVGDFPCRYLSIPLHFKK